MSQEQAKIHRNPLQVLKEFNQQKGLEAQMRIGEIEAFAVSILAVACLVAAEKGSYLEGTSPLVRNLLTAAFVGIALVAELEREGFARLRTPQRTQMTTPDTQQVTVQEVPQLTSPEVVVTPGASPLLPSVEPVYREETEQDIRTQEEIEIDVLQHAASFENPEEDAKVIIKGTKSLLSGTLDSTSSPFVAHAELAQSVVTSMAQHNQVDDLEHDEERANANTVIDFVTGAYEREVKKQGALQETAYAQAEKGEKMDTSSFHPYDYAINLATLLRLQRDQRDHEGWLDTARIFSQFLASGQRLAILGQEHPEHLLATSDYLRGVEAAIGVFAGATINDHPEIAFDIARDEHFDAFIGIDQETGYPVLYQRGKRDALDVLGDFYSDTTDWTNQRELDAITARYDQLDQKVTQVHLMFALDRFDKIAEGETEIMANEVTIPSETFMDPTSLSRFFDMQEGEYDQDDVFPDASYLSTLFGQPLLDYVSNSHNWPESTRMSMIDETDEGEIDNVETSGSVDPENKSVSVVIQSRTGSDLEQNTSQKAIHTFESYETHENTVYTRTDTILPYTTPDQSNITVLTNEQPPTDGSFMPDVKTAVRMVQSDDTTYLYLQRQDKPNVIAIREGKMQLYTDNAATAAIFS